MTDEAVRAGQVWGSNEYGPWFVVAVSKMVSTGQELVTYRLTNDSREFWTTPLDRWRGMGLVRRR